MFGPGVTSGVGWGKCAIRWLTLAFVGFQVTLPELLISNGRIGDPQSVIVPDHFNRSRACPGRPPVTGLGTSTYGSTRVLIQPYGGFVVHDA